ncbi:MAG: RHS repeat-associated core domain-containing protein, partial [Alphaproteobacteria bacterium]
SRQFYHVNHQRSTVAITDDGGVVIEQFTYNAWGESNDSLTGNPFRYTGRRLDQETGLYYYRARYYSPALGRFLQTDPIGYADGMNMYAYVGNSPVSFGDPSGLSRFLAIGPIDEVNMTVRVVRDSPTNECPSCIATRQINENAEYTEGIQGVPVDSPFVGTGGVGEVGGGRPAGLPGSGRGLAYANDVYGEEIAPNPYGETVQFPTFFVGFLSVRSVINPSAQYSSATTIRVSLLFTYSITLSQNRWTNAQHITGFTQGIGQQLGVGGFGVGGRIELNSFEGPNGEALNRVEAKGTFGVGKRSAPQDPQGGVRDEFTLFESGNFKDPLLEAQKRGGVIPAP